MRWPVLPWTDFQLEVMVAPIFPAGHARALPRGLSGRVTPFLLGRGGPIHLIHIVLDSNLFRVQPGRPSILLL